MSAPPYMKLWIADFVADTLHLNRAQVGSYQLLLMAMWRAGGKLPANDAKLAQIARCTPKEWAADRDTMLSLFQRRGGQLTHKRLAEEMAHAQAVSVAKRRGPKGVENGTRSEKPRKSKRQAVANAPPNAGIYQSHITPLTPQGDKEDFAGKLGALPLPPELVRAVVSSKGQLFAWDKLKDARWEDGPPCRLVVPRYAAHLKLMEFCRSEFRHFGVDCVLLEDVR
jgi:uncharacterized protein YdaU (DUF1376 family)